MERNCAEPVHRLYAGCALSCVICPGLRLAMQCIHNMCAETASFSFANTHDLSPFGQLKGVDAHALESALTILC